MISLIEINEIIGGFDYTKKFTVFFDFFFVSFFNFSSLFSSSAFFFFFHFNWMATMKTKNAAHFIIAVRQIIDVCIRNWK